MSDAVPRGNAEGDAQHRVAFWQRSPFSDDAKWLGAASVISVVVLDPVCEVGFSAFAT